MKTVKLAKLKTFGSSCVHDHWGDRHSLSYLAERGKWRGTQCLSFSNVSVDSRRARAHGDGVDHKGQCLGPHGGSVVSAWFFHPFLCHSPTFSWLLPKAHSLFEQTEFVPSGWREVALLPAAGPSWGMLGWEPGLISLPLPQGYHVCHLPAPPSLHFPASPSSWAVSRVSFWERPPAGYLLTPCN